MSTLNTQILNDGPRNVTIKGNIVGDAVELSDELFVDASGLSGAPTNLKIVGIKSNLEAFAAELLWDATANVSIFDLPPGDNVDQDFRRFGGLQNNAGAGVTGDILISTSGIAVGETGTVILELKKS